MTDAPLPPRQLRWSLWLPLVLFIGFVALVMLGLLRPASHDIRSQMVGKPLPQFTLRAAVPDRPGLAATDFASGKPRCGQVRDSQREFLFGADAVNIGSVALVPLMELSPPGLLALGSVEKERFHPGMSTEFLARMGSLIAAAISRS